MVDEHDLEKGELQVAHPPEASVEREDSKDLGVGEHVEKDSNHLPRRSSIDTIEPVPLDSMQKVSHSKSHTSSMRSRPILTVPRSKRRGLLGRCAIIPEVERPHEYKNGTKWTITAIIALAAAAAPMGSAIFYRRSSTLNETCHFPILCH